MQNIKIILLGVNTTIAQSILGQCAAHNIPADDIELFDAHYKHIPYIWYQNTAKKVTPVDLFQVKPPYVALICDKEIPQNYPDKKIPKNSWVIDCTGVLRSAPCIVPPLNLDQIHQAPRRLLCAPTSLSVILSHTLHELKKYTLDIDVVALIGTSFLGHESAQILKSQTKDVYHHNTLSETNFPPLAFNLIPQIVPDNKTTTPCQIKCITDIDIHFAHCFTPIFRGYSVHVSCVLNKKFNDKIFNSLWRKNPCVTRLEQTAPDFILSSAATLSESHAFISHPKYDTHRLSFWITGDDIQCGMALNVIHIIQTLIQK